MIECTFLLFNAHESFAPVNLCKRLSSVESWANEINWATQNWSWKSVETKPELYIYERIDVGYLVVENIDPVHELCMFLNINFAISMA